MMAARTGKTDAIKVLLEAGAKVNAKETWGGTTRADVGGVRAASRGGQAAARRTAPTSTRDPTSWRPPTAAASKDARRWPSQTDRKVEEFASGWLTPLMFAAREGDVELGAAPGRRRRRRECDGRRRQERAGAGDLQRQLRGWPRSWSTTRRTSTRPTRSDSRRCSGRSIAATWKRRRTSRGW